MPSPHDDKDAQHCQWGRNLDNPFASYRQYVDQTINDIVQPYTNALWGPRSDEKTREVARKNGCPAFSDASIAEKSRKDDTAEPDSTGMGDIDLKPQAWAALCQALMSISQSQSPLEDISRLSEGIMERPFSQSLGPFVFSYNPSGNASMDLWLARYLTYSPYSPTHLESHGELGMFGSYWRRAFEDLLDSEDGGEMLPDRPRHTSLRPFDWVQLMVDRAASPTNRVPAEKKLLRDAFAHGADDDEGFTELDLYERFLKSYCEKESDDKIQALQRQDEQRRTNREDRNKTASTSTATTNTQEFDFTTRSATEASDATKRQGIVATLTTTERVMLPDGTTHTKVVLKKRFEDGREESSETVQTTQGQHEKRRDIASNDKGEGRGNKPKVEEKVKDKGTKGWFWS